VLSVQVALYAQNAMLAFILMEIPAKAVFLPVLLVYQTQYAQIAFMDTVLTTAPVIFLVTISAVYVLMEFALAVMMGII
jgi:hypothetical protein